MNNLYKLNLLFAVTIIVIALSSCKNREHFKNNPEEVRIDMGDQSNENIEIEIEEVIPLETNQNCLIGDILNLKYFNNHFYIIDYLQSKTVFAFSNTGKFVKKLENGKGPGEVIQPLAFAFNPDDSTVIVHDPFLQKNLFYNLNLEYIKSKDYSNQSILGFHKIIADTFLIYEYESETWNFNQRRNRMFSLYISHLNKSVPFKIYENFNKTATCIINNVSIFNDTVLFCCPYSYTIYELSKGKPSERYKLEFGNFGYTPEELETLSSKELLNGAYKGQKVGTIECIYNTRDFFVIRPIFTRKQVYAFKSKQTNKVFFLNRYFSTLLPECTIYDTFNQNLFVASVEPEAFNHFKKVNDKFDKNEVKISANPIIIIFKVTEKL